MTDPTDHTSDNARNTFTLNKVIVLSAALGALVAIVLLLIFFPFQTGFVLGILSFIGWAVVSSIPSVKKTTSHTTTIKRG